MATKVTRWNPWREMEEAAQRIEQMFGEGGDLVHPLALDAYVTEDEIVITASVPGVDPENLSINIEDNVLTIRGMINTQIEREDGKYVMRERRSGQFERSLRLGVPVDVNKAEAIFDHGVLTLTLPKAPEARPQQIPVRAAIQN